MGIRYRLNYVVRGAESSNGGVVASDYSETQRGGNVLDDKLREQLEELAVRRYCAGCPVRLTLTIKQGDPLKVSARNGHPLGRLYNNIREFLGR